MATSRSGPAKRATTPRSSAPTSKAAETPETPETPETSDRADAAAVSEAATVDRTPDPDPDPPSAGPEVTETSEIVSDAPPPPAAPRPRVSMVTLQQAVLHRQRATGVDALQEALGLPPTGTPDDALDAAVGEARAAHGLGPGTVDVALLGALGFDVVVD